LKNTVFLLLFSLLTFSLFSQEKKGKDNTAKVKKIQEFYFFGENDFAIDSIPYQKLDTTFTPFFYYNPQLFNFKTNLGNNGTAQKDLVYSPVSSIGFKTKMDQIEDFRFNHNNTNYFQVTQPYAKVAYINGAQKEEGIDIEFSQNINENWNVGVEYKKVSSVGFYERQRANINSFKVFQSFKTKNNRYGVIANFNYNDSYNEENGGIRNDSLFTEAPKTSRKGVAINFSNARNLSRNQEFYVQQYLNFGQIKTTYYKDENDSLYPDSILTTRIIPILSPFHEFIYNNKEIGFEDQNADSTNYPIGTVSNNGFIADFTNIREIDNNLGVRLIPFKNETGFLKSIQLSVFGGFQYLEYYQKEFHTSVNLNDKFYTNSLFGASISNNLNSKYHYKFNFNKVFEGFDQGDQSIQLLSINKLGKIKVKGQIKIDQLNPDLVFRDFKSTTYSWGGELKLINRNHVNVELGVPHLKFKIGASYDNTENHTYFDSNSVIKQFNGGLGIFQVNMSQLFTVWKFHLNLNLRYQSTDKKGIINLPEFISYTSLYFENTLFKKEMLLRIGTDLYFATDYTGDSYNPIIRQYQSQTTTTINGYPWLEAYLMVKVDRTYFFARMTNLLEGAVPNNYFAAPGYPMADRAFKFGIKWEFIN